MTVWLNLILDVIMKATLSFLTYVILKPWVFFPGYDYATLCAAIQWPKSLADLLAVNWLCVEWQLTDKSIMNL